MRYALAGYLAGATLARLGDEISGPALLLAGLAATGSPTSASALLAGLTVAAAIGGPAFGAVLDRARTPGRVLALALAAYVTALGAVALCVGRVPIPYAVAIAVIGGLFGPALSGGWTAQLPSTTTLDGLPRASALDAMTYNISGLVGPAAAGGLAVAFSARTSVVVAIALIASAIPRALRLPGRRQTAELYRAAKLLDGFRAIRDRPALRLATTASVISCAGEGILVACSPLIGQAHLGGAGHGAMLLSVVAVAALAANTAMARRPNLLRPDTIIWASPLVIACGLALAALGRPIGVLAAAVVIGAAEGPQLTALFTIRHRESPERMRAQIFTTGASLKISALALGAAVAGPLATWSLQSALLTAAGIQVAACLPSAAAAWHRRGAGARPSRLRQKC